MATQLTVLRKTAMAARWWSMVARQTRRFVDAASRLRPLASPYSASTRDEIVLSIGALDAEPDLKLGGTIAAKTRRETRMYFASSGLCSRTGGAAAPQPFPGYGTLRDREPLRGQHDRRRRCGCAQPIQAGITPTALDESLRAAFEDANVPVVNVLSRARLLRQRDISIQYHHRAVTHGRSPDRDCGRAGFGRHDEPERDGAHARGRCDARGWRRIA